MVGTRGSCSWSGPGSSLRTSLIAWRPTPGSGCESWATSLRPRSQSRSSRDSVLGSINELHDVFREQVVDEVAICLPPAASRLLEPIASVASGEGKTVRIAVDPIEEILPSAVQEEFDGIIVRSLVNDGQREAALILKRLIDVVGATVGLVLLSPILLGAAVALRLRDGSPVLFRQERVGLHGRPFTMLKFRTMVVDAEDRLAEVSHMNERNGAAFKATNDPRITPVGRFLRRTSIDELPQLWNVLAGSMSLVGPSSAAAGRGG